LAHEHVRRIAFEPPALDVPTRVLHVYREVEVRVRPLDADDLAGQLDGFFTVENGCKRMMCGREARDAKAAADQ
jgi:hypothetical protein